MLPSPLRRFLCFIHYHILRRQGKSFIAGPENLPCRARRDAQKYLLQAVQILSAVVIYCKQNEGGVPLKKVFAVLLALILCVNLCAAAYADDGWTIFVYVCGADLESEAGLASQNIREMVDAHTSANIRFVVQTGGAASWSSDPLSGARGKPQRGKRSVGVLSARGAGLHGARDLQGHLHQRKLSRPRG